MIHVSQYKLPIILQIELQDIFIILHVLGVNNYVKKVSMLPFVEVMDLHFLVEVIHIY